MKRTISLLAVFCILLACFTTPASAEGGYYGGAASYDIYFTENMSDGNWGIFEHTWVNTYVGTATYDASFIVLLYNLSGTVYWDNYKNEKGTAQSMKIGISTATTVGRESSWGTTRALGFAVPVKAAEVSAEIGGSYTNSKTYQRTLGTSLEYEINTQSKNGYYAVTHAANCDSYMVDVDFYSGRDASENYTSTGILIRFASANGYERLWYSSSNF